MGTLEEALNKAAQALQAGSPDKAIEILTNLPESEKTQTTVLSALGISYRQGGNLTEALKSIEKALSIDPKNPKAWVLKGTILEEQNEDKQALQSYQTAIDLTKNITTLPPHLSRDIENSHRRIAAIISTFEKRTLDELKKIGYNKNDPHNRFAKGLDILFGRRNIFHQEPKQFYFPELPQKEFYNPDDFPWTMDLKANFEAIRKEAQTLLSSPELFSPYVESNNLNPAGDHSMMVDNDEWSAFYLIKDGENISENQAICPITMETLKNVDLCETKGPTPSVLFSLLKPGAHIPPHNGMLNCRLICHLPLIVPDDCSFRVGGQTIKWREGEPIIFDDSINHEARNDSNENRIVLLFDIWRPELTIKEREFVSTLLGIGSFTT